jgi:hypothetical protein
MKSALPRIGLVFVVLLAGCEAPAVEEKTHTVSEFKANNELLQEFLKKCNENPGELRDKPNCINVTMAAQELVLEHRKKLSQGGWSSQPK